MMVHNPPEGFLSDDARYAISVLMPEMAKAFEQYSKEYQAPRQLGVRAEFVEIHRKTQKLKLALWEGVDTSDWREQPRTILMELAAHCFLAVRDLDGVAKNPSIDFSFAPRCGVKCNEEKKHFKNDAGCTYWGIEDEAPETQPYDHQDF